MSLIYFYLRNKFINLLIYMYTKILNIYILLLLLSDLGNARVIIEALLLIETITPYIYIYIYIYYTNV